MAKVVELNIINGDFAQGFTVHVEIRQEGRLISRTIENLPPAPDIPELYQNFQEIYNHLDQRFLVFQIPPDQNNHFSTIAECRQAARRLEMRLEEWFDHPSIKTLRLHIEKYVNRTEPTQIIFQTDNEILKKLPWHLWELFEILPKAWFSLSTTFNINTPSQPLKRPVRILAILGSDQNTDPNTNNFERDGNLFNNLPGARVKKLPTPTRQELCQELQNEDSWDIVCFSGHSWSINTNNDGQLQINPSDSPSMRELRNAFRGAIQNGLKLVIFSSCDGSGLANRLVQFQIPQVIIMRELVPDEVAHQFLKEFLQLFSQGELFYLAVRKAQENLQSIEDEYPCASWLPIICQNPAAKSPVWPHLINIYKLKRGIKKFLRNNSLAVFINLVLIGLFIFILIGILTGKINVPGVRTGESPKPSPSPKVTTVSTISPSNTQTEVDKFFSRGNQILITKNTNPNKEKGIIAFNAPQWESAINHFRESLKSQPNDPETLIYLNNAIAELRQSQGQNYLKIAVTVPITSNQERSENILRGVAHAQSELNCGNVDNIINFIKNDSSTDVNTCTGGINNQPLVVEIVDDQDNAYNVEKLAEDIIKLERNILAVIGHYSSKTTIAALNGYNDQIVLISPTSTSTELNTNTLQLFRTATDDNIAVEQLREHVRHLGTNITASVAYDFKDTYSKSLKKIFMGRLPSRDFLGGEYNLDINPNTFTAQNIVQRIIKLNANLLLLIPSAKGNTLDNALQLIKEVSQLQDHNLILLGGDSIYSPKIEIQESAKSKIKIAVPWQNATDQLGLKFENDAKQLWTDTVKVSWRNAMAYDAAKAIITGLTQMNWNLNNSELIDYRQQLKQVMSNTNFSAEGVTKVRFNSLGERDITALKDLGVLVQVECNSYKSCKFVKYNQPD